MIQDVLEFAAQKVKQGGNAVLVTVQKTFGSSPATTGQIMAVANDGETCGTVGGGASEHKLVERSIRAMRDGERTFDFSFDHAEDDMSCGGGMAGYGNVLGAREKLFIFGGGHVAQSLAPLCSSAGFAVAVIEDRPEFGPLFQAANYIVSTPGEFEQKLLTDENSYAVICTRGHRTDEAALRFCLSGSFRYIGMIGSRKKAGEIFDKLRGEGISQESLERVYAPVGLDIASSVPFEIAVAILAELLLVKNKGTLTHKKLL